MDKEMLVDTSCALATGCDTARIFQQVESCKKPNFWVTYKLDFHHVLTTHVLTTSYEEPMLSMKANSMLAYSVHCGVCSLTLFRCHLFLRRSELSAHIQVSIAF